MKQGMHWMTAALSAVLMIFSAAAAGQEPEVCWKHSYGRGVGTVPTACPAGANEAGLCYSQCPAGYTGVGILCHQNCPAGFGSATAADISCSKPGTYSRSTHTLILSGPADCQAASEGRGCEQFVALLYPRPRPGFQCGDAGVICSAVCPAGMPDQGLFCAKVPARQRTVALPSCSGALQADAGLCYSGCQTEYKGVGPVCWGNCPKATHPVDCGALCGRTEKDCADAIIAQIVSVFEVIGNVASTIATLGAGTAATSAARAGAKATIGGAVKNAALSSAKKAIIKANLIKLLRDTGKSMAESAIEEATKAAAGEDFDFTVLDPTGIASAVQAFNKPICTAPVQTAGSGGQSGPPAGFVSGSLVKASNDAAVYLVNRIGQKQLVNGAIFDACGLRWSSLQVHDPARVNPVATGPALMTVQACQAARSGALPGGAIVKTGDAPTVYLLNALGQRQAIASAQVFDGCGLQWPALVTAPAAALQTSPVGAPLATAQACLTAHVSAIAGAASKGAAALIKTPNEATVYLVNRAGQKQAIASPQVFDGCGLQWPALQTLAAAVVNALPTGAPLTTAAACQAAR